MPEECENCGLEEDDTHIIGVSDLGIHPGLCEWCAAEEADYPFGRCRNCRGAKAADKTCGCRPRKH